MYGCCVLPIMCFVFEAVVVLHAWVLYTRCLIKLVALVALSLPLCVPNVALYGTIAPLGFSVPDALCRLRPRQVRGILLALNSQKALATWTTHPLWSVPTLHALCLSH